MAQHVILRETATFLCLNKRSPLLAFARRHDGWSQLYPSRRQPARGQALAVLCAQPAQAAAAAAAQAAAQAAHQQGGSAGSWCATGEQHLAAQH